MKKYRKGKTHQNENFKKIVPPYKPSFRLVQPRKPKRTNVRKTPFFSAFFPKQFNS